MAIQMRRGNLADFDPTKQMPGEFAVTLDTDSNLNKRVYIAFAAGTVKQLMTVEDATAQMIEATDAATAEAEAWAHGNSFTATEMFTSAGSATVTLAYSPSSITAVKINDVATTAYTRNDKVITFNTAPAVGSTITVIYSVSTSTDNAKYYKEQADTSATSAATNAVAAESYAVGGTGSRTGEDTDNAKYYKEQANLSADDADDYATLAESYAVGGTGTRPGEDSDNAEYYYEQARDISQSLTGALKPRGTVTYVNLPSLSVAAAGDMYNVSDAFTTTNDFKEGAGHHINAGANVYKTFDGKWDILAGTPVTGVKGDKEQNYRQGNVNLTPANIGAVPTPATSGTNGQVLSTDGQGNTSWKDVQSPLTFDDFPTQNSGNPVKSGGIFSKIGDLTQTGLTGDSVAGQLGNLKTALTPVSFQVTLSDNITNVRIYDQYNFYIPATGEVHLNFLVYSGDGNIPANNRVIATIPEAYRPRVAKQFLCELGDTSNQPIRGERGYVSTGGSICLNNFIYGDKAIQWVYLNYSYII